MSLAACAELVRRGDPDRFLAAMAAPPPARTVLFPLYAFNLEVARAPWVTQEPLIAEMRLQWWRDVLSEIAAGGRVRRHEVVDALASVLDPAGCDALAALIDARVWDIGAAPFDGWAAFHRYIDATAGGLMWTAVRRLGGADLAAQEAGAVRAEPEDPPLAEDVVRRLGRAAGIARFLQAVPALTARGRRPLIEDRPEVLADLARAALAEAGDWPVVKRCVPRAARAGMLEGWIARPVLRRAAAEPGRIAAGELEPSPFAKRLRLMWWALPGAT